jgi:hypothetical protein
VTDAAGTRLRAELRGREAVARSRIRIAVWVVRMFATLSAVTILIALFGPGGPHWVAALALGVWGAGLLLTAHRIERGSRIDAAILFGLFVVGDVARWLTVGNPSLFSAAVSVAVLLATGNALRGTFELARIRREEAESLLS